MFPKDIFILIIIIICVDGVGMDGGFLLMTEDSIGASSSRREKGERGGREGGREGGKRERKGE